MLSISDIEALPTRPGKALYIVTDGSDVHVVKNPKDVRKEVGDSPIRSVNWMTLCTY
jgi:hypothetical protein